MAKAMFGTESVQAGNLADLASPTPGGIVSKALIDAGGLRQVLFSMDEGQQISQHKAPFVATVQVLTGRMRFGVGGQDRTMGPHDWLVMPPNEPHDLTAEEPTTFLLTLLKGEGGRAAAPVGE